MCYEIYDFWIIKGGESIIATLLFRKKKQFSILVIFIIDIKGVTYDVNFYLTLAFLLSTCKLVL